MTGKNEPLQAELKSRAKKVRVSKCGKKSDGKLIYWPDCAPPDKSVSAWHS